MREGGEHVSVTELEKITETVENALSVWKYFTEKEKEVKRAIFEVGQRIEIDKKNKALRVEKLKTVMNDPESTPTRRKIAEGEIEELETHPVKLTNAEVEYLQELRSDCEEALKECREINIFEHLRSARAGLEQMRTECQKIDVQQGQLLVGGCVKDLERLIS